MIRMFGEKTELRLVIQTSEIPHSGICEVVLLSVLCSIFINQVAVGRQWTNVTCSNKFGRQFRSHAATRLYNGLNCDFQLLTLERVPHAGAWVYKKTHVLG